MHPEQQKNRSMSAIRCGTGYLPHASPQRSHSRVGDISVMRAFGTASDWLAVHVDLNGVRAFCDERAEKKDSDKEHKHKHEKVEQRWPLFPQTVAGGQIIRLRECAHDYLRAFELLVTPMPGSAGLRARCDEGFLEHILFIAHSADQLEVIHARG